MNTDVLINWFESRRGKLTYSMYGSRNGSDGTADCSGAISQALTYDRPKGDDHEEE